MYLEHSRDRGCVDETGYLWKELRPGGLQMFIKVPHVLILCLGSLAFAGDNWPDFRGPGADGHSDSTGLRLDWS